MNTLCHRLYLLFALLLVVGVSVRAERRHSDYYFKHVTIANGLSSSQVNAICKDSKGFVWLGTSNGLNRYDGYHIKSFVSDYRNSSALPDGYVESIQEDKDGNLWIGTSSGYVVMNPVTELFDRGIQQRLSKALGNLEPTLICIDRNKNMWIYTQGKGVFYAKTQMDLVYSFPQDGGRNSLPAGRITGLCETTQGAVVAYEDGTICSLDGENQKVLWINNVLPKHGVPRDKYQVSVDSRGDIFLYSSIRNYIYDGQTHEWVRSLRELAEKWGCFWELDDAIITAVCEDLNHFVWLSTDRTGLLLLDIGERSFRRHLKHTSDARSLSANNVRSLYIDDSNLLWVGTLRFGASYWGFSIYRFILDRIGDVCDISEDAAGNLWLAMGDEGLMMKSAADTTYHRYSRASGLNDNSISCVHVARDGSVWSGSNRYGLNRIKDGVVQHFRHEEGNPQSLAADDVRDIVEDMNGNIWIATMGGGMQCYNVNRGVFSNFNEANSKLPSNDVTSLCTKGNMLVAGTLDGVVIVNLSNNQVEFFRGTRSGDRHFTSIHVTQVLIDSRGLVWVGTRSGLNLLSTQNDMVQSFGMEQGMPNNMICGLAEDANKHIWVTTAGGVCRLVPRTELNDEGERSVYVYNYTVDDGLQGTEFNVGSICSGRSGIHMGGSNGLNWMNIDQTQARNAETKVLFTGLIYDGKRVDIGSRVNGHVILPIDLNSMTQLEMPSDMNSFAIEMSISNYYRFEPPQFMYKLDGRDEAWRPAEADMHGVRFNHLAPGTYTLRVKYINESKSDDVEEQEHLLEIVIAYPWWLSWWAITLYVLLLILLILFLRFGIPYLNKLFLDSRRERDLYQKRADALRSITATLMAPISKMMNQVRMLRPMLSSPEQREILEQIMRIEQQLLNELRDSSSEDIQALLPAELRRVRAVTDEDVADVPKQKAEEEPDPENEQVEAEPTEQESGSKRKAQKRSIYLVDSDPDLAEFISDSLKSYYDFTIFTTCEQAWTAISEHRPDLVIAYENMPDAKGSDLCTRMKHDKGLARIPFVLMLETSMSVAEIEKHGVTLAADDYVLHFYDLIALNVRCSRLLGDPVDQSQMPIEEAMISANAMTDGVNELIRRHVREFVMQNISTHKLPLYEMCDAIGIPLPQLFRKIEKLTGKTPAGYIREIRLSEAATLLKNTDLLPIDVAAEVGMPNMALFNRFFKEQYGVTPMEFCEQHHQ